MQPECFPRTLGPAERDSLRRDDRSRFDGMPALALFLAGSRRLTPIELSEYAASLRKDSETSPPIIGVWGLAFPQPR